jgi:hypothetical protein
MSYRTIDGDGLRTTYSFAPEVRAHAEQDGPTMVQLKFISSAVYSDEQEPRTTELTFKHVVFYEWNDFEFHRVPCNPGDIEFGLIELTDSPIVGEITSTGRYIGSALRHFRISFDDHGTYDVLCEELEISYN